jgi:hypothetical protein
LQLRDITNRDAIQLFRLYQAVFRIYAYVRLHVPVCVMLFIALTVHKRSISSLLISFCNLHWMTSTFRHCWVDGLVLGQRRHAPRLCTLLRCHQRTHTHNCVLDLVGAVLVHPAGMAGLIVIILSYMCTAPVDRRGNYKERQVQ